MTSELIDSLLDQYWDAAFKEGSECREHDTKDGNAQSIRTQLIEELNTRAVPDVTELVRYDFSQHNMVRGQEGYWVKHHEAAAMLTAKDAELLSLSRSLSFTDKLAAQRLERAKTAEAELAQIKAQEPVGYLWQHPDHANDFVSSDSGNQLTDDNKEYGWSEIPLYAAPVDQTAEIERYRDALNKIAGYDGDIESEAHAFCIESASAALSGKSPS